MEKVSNWLITSLNFLRGDGPIIRSGLGAFIVVHTFALGAWAVEVCRKVYGWATKAPPSSPSVIGFDLPRAVSQMIVAGVLWGLLGGIVCVRLFESPILPYFGIALLVLSLVLIVRRGGKLADTLFGAEEKADAPLIIRQVQFFALDSIWAGIAAGLLVWPLLSSVVVAFYAATNLATGLILAKETQP